VRGRGWVQSAPPRALAGAGAGKFFPRGDGDGKPFPDGEFPVAIPNCSCSAFLEHNRKYRVGEVDGRQTARCTTSRHSVVVNTYSIRFGKRSRFGQGFGQKLRI
jgi:hypothetical protein